MAKHRGHNEGTIYERTYTRKDGTKITKYVALAPIDASGKRPSLGGFTTKAEAREAIKQAEAARTQGLPVAGKVPTVGEWFDTWLAGRMRIAYATRAGYSASLGVMRTYIGSLKLDALTESDIAGMWEKLRTGEAANGSERTPLSLTTLHRYHAHLKAALASAVRNRRIPVAWNPASAEEARPERGERKPINPLSEDEVKRLFGATRTPQERVMFVVLVTTGMRPGEAQALQWPDIDFEHWRLSVQHSLHRETGKGLVVGPTKTRKTRSITLRPETVAVLREHKTRQAEMQLAAGSLWTDQGFVFTDEAGGPYDQK